MHGSVTPAIVGVSQAYLAWPKITEMDPLLAQRDTTRTRLTRVKQAESEQIVDVGSGRDRARVPAVPGRGARLRQAGEPAAVLRGSRSVPGPLPRRSGRRLAATREQASMIRRHIIWRNSHAYDERLRRVIDRANVA